MKLHKAIDRRLISQLSVLGILTVLPLAMITLNGSRAIHAILTPVSAGSAGDALQDDSAKVNRAAPLCFGAYDPAGVFAADQALQVRHVYVSWLSFDRSELAKELRSLEQQEFQPLLTIEPWPAADAVRPLFTGILEGDYDHMIDGLAGVLRQLAGPVYISWGHEMDQDLTERYPWSNAEPDQFIAAYRYVVDRIRDQVDTPLRWVWAGVLKNGSLRYWPGPEYADLVGLPIYSFPAWDQKTYGFIRDFRTTFEEKRKLVAELRKPLMITELGVSGSADFEHFWLHQAFLALGLP